MSNRGKRENYVFRRTLIVSRYEQSTPSMTMTVAHVIHRCILPGLAGVIFVRLSAMGGVKGLGLSGSDISFYVIRRRYAFDTRSIRDDLRGGRSLQSYEHKCT
jgi:hypothetical protein